MATPKNTSVIKAFDILRLLGSAARPLSAQEIARDTGATLSTTHRFLLTLEEVGAVARSVGNLYHLGMLISELGRNAGSDRILTERARVLIEALAEELGETVSLTLFTEGEMRKAAWHEPNRPLVCRERSDLGPAMHCTAAGKLWFSWLPATVREESFSVLRMEPLTPNSVRTVEDLRKQVREIAETGVAFSFEEAEQGLVEIAVPVTSARGEILGALTLSAPLSRMDDARRQRAVAAMRQTVQTITRRVFVKSYTIPGKARPRGSFPHVKRAGNLVFVSGTSSRRPDDSFAGVTVFPDGSVYHDIFEQTRESMLNVADILGSLALRPRDIVNLEAFLTDMREEDRFRAALDRSFEGAVPPVTVVAARALPHPHQAVMIKALACDAA